MAGRPVCNVRPGRIKCTCDGLTPAKGLRLRLRLDSLLPLLSLFLAHIAGPVALSSSSSLACLFCSIGTR
jgi:hypothetical protein